MQIQGITTPTPIISPAGGRKSGKIKELKSEKPKAKKSPSNAKAHLNPTEILSDCCGDTLEERWNRFSARLDNAGFESCGFLRSRNDVESPLSHKDSLIMGEVISSEYFKFVRENPNMQSQARPYRMMRTSRSPVTFLRDEDLLCSTPSERKLAQKINNDFNIKGWALTPVHAPENQQLFCLGWWNLDNQEEARKLWAAEGGAFTLAATYFVESISKIVNREHSEFAPQLSNREMECLLWAGAGKTTAEIAAILNVADATIEEYFKRAAKKLGATTRAQACVKAIINGFIKP